MRREALARTYRALTESNWAGHNLADIVRSELEPFSSRAKIEGSGIFLNARYAQSISLALHELATNAVKHGALSNASGEVRIALGVNGAGADAMLTFQWQERGGPPVAPPQHAGFGNTLLKASFGKARVDYAPAGLLYEVNIPLSLITTPEGR